MGFGGAYCGSPHRCSPEARPSWLTAKPNPLRIPAPGLQLWVSALAGVATAGLHGPYWFSSGVVLKGKKGEGGGWGTQPCGHRLSFLPCPGMAPPMTRNSRLGWKGDPGSLSLAHAHAHGMPTPVPWRELDELAPPPRLEPPAPFTGHFFSCPSGKGPNSRLGQLFVCSLVPSIIPLKRPSPWLPLNSAEG